MPVYLVFLHVAKNNFQLALRGPNLPASLEARKLQQGTRHRRHFFLRFAVLVLCTQVNMMFVMLL